MLLALAAYENRIASVFESLDRFLIVDFKDRECHIVSTVKVNNPDFSNLMAIMKTNHADLLICGAINRCCRQLVEGQGIRIIPWVKGEIDHVMDAFSQDNLNSGDFIMPGCRRRGRGWQGGPMGARGKGRTKKSF
ncbi:MAG: NifB/NifX family molybdenum-iron cluster-binding protein [candidate division KSB1 bacterium]|jgi:predicted Fe-Mo cluster-binding NifX family protein|nr:NifB/NifX family molybdenum-iron cluster-binding protein [candidate division KSB1 bacterium]